MLIQASNRSLPETPVPATIVRVPWQIKLLPFESGRGFLTRAAGSLGYGGPGTLIELAAPYRQRNPGPAVIKHLSVLLRQDPEKFAEHFHIPIGEKSGPGEKRFHGHHIHSRDLIRVDPRICPVCMDEEPVCRSLWDLRLVTACPIHGCELIGRCPKCGQRLSWARPELAKCACGHNLADANSTTAHREVIALIKVIDRSLRGLRAIDHVIEEAEFHEDLLALDLPSLLKLIWFVGSAFHPDVRGLSSSAPSWNDPSSVADIVAAAGHILANWPQRYVERIRSECNLAPPPESRQYRHMDYYSTLCTRLKEPKLQFMRDPFVDFVRENWEKLARGHHAWAKSVARIEDQWMEAGQALEMLPALSADGIRRRIREGTLPGLRAAGPSGKSRNWVDLKRLQESVNEAARWMPLKDVSNVLGLKECTAIALTRARLIKFKKEKVLGRRGDWNFWKQDVDRIVEAFERHQPNLVANYSRSNESITLGEALYVLGVGLPAAVAGVIGGHLKPLGKAGKFNGIHDYIFPAEDLRRYRRAGKATADGPFLNQVEAAKHLGVIPNIVGALIQEGFVSSPRDYVCGEARLVALKDLADFQKRYVLAGQLAKTTNTSASWITWYLASQGVVGMPAKRAGRSVCTVYNKADLEHFEISAPMAMNKTEEQS